jgi:hypothetical protein
MCEFFPEITNCVDCEYFDLREINSCFSDFEPVCLKREEEKTKRIEEKKQTFAEWLLNFVKTHRDVTWSIEQGPCGEIQVHIRDYSKSRSGVNAKCSILPETYQNSKLSFDEILIVAAKELCEEIENYGK